VAQVVQHLPSKSEALSSNPHFNQKKRINNQNVKLENIKNKKKHRKKLYDTGFGNDFLDMASKVLATKTNADKREHIKSENLCIA
jgi:hypothetical protein